MKVKVWSRHLPPTGNFSPPIGRLFRSILHHHHQTLSSSNSSNSNNKNISSVNSIKHYLHQVQTTRTSLQSGQFPQTLSSSNSNNKSSLNITTILILSTFQPIPTKLLFPSRSAFQLATGETIKQVPQVKCEIWAMWKLPQVKCEQLWNLPHVKCEIWKCEKLSNYPAGQCHISRIP